MEFRTTVGNLDAFQAAANLAKRAAGAETQILPMITSGDVIVAESFAGSVFATRGVAMGAEDTIADGLENALNNFSENTVTSGENAATTIGEDVGGAAARTSAADTTPYAGQALYRVYVGDSNAGVASWSALNPANVADYRDAAG